MAGGFDELIEFLLTQIAYAGENGESAPSFLLLPSKTRQDDGQVLSKHLPLDQKAPKQKKDTKQ